MFVEQEQARDDDLQEELVGIVAPTKVGHDRDLSPANAMGPDAASRRVQIKYPIEQILQILL
jgi:hypothetical protein